MNEIPEIVGASTNIEQVKELIDNIANVELSTIICGETESVKISLSKTFIRSQVVVENPS